MMFQQICAAQAKPGPHLTDNTPIDFIAYFTHAGDSEPLFILKLSLHFLIHKSNSM